MKKGLEEKITLQIVSIGVAIVLWFIITYSENPVIDTTRTIPIAYTHTETLLSKGLTAIYSDRTPTVTVVLRGKRNDLFNVIQNLSANVDLSTINTSGSYDMPINVNVPLSTVEIVHKRTPNLNVSVEQIVSKDIPVHIQQTGINRQYLVKSAADTQTIAVHGPNSAVSAVDHATVTVDISNINQNQISNYNYILSDIENNEFENPNISAETANITISNTVYVSKTVAINVEFSGTVKEDYTVDITNADSLFANIGVLSSSYDDITSLTAHFPDNIAEAQDAKISVPLELPDFVYMPQGPNITITANITKKQVRELSVPVTLQNIPDGLSVTSSDSSIAVVAKGPSDQLDPLLMTANADLSGLTAGTHNVTVAFITPGDVSIKQTYTVNVTLG